MNLISMLTPDQKKPRWVVGMPGPRKQGRIYLRYRSKGSFSRTSKFEEAQVFRTEKGAIEAAADIARGWHPEAKVLDYDAEACRLMIALTEKLKGKVSDVVPTGEHE